ncbi:dTDP-4-dehydrorhamnose reductase [Subtercola boreus]|uniref:dTDP-4-dehydrorhamnose reductase n=1 Tax=Subtercola boreus TaxID=120213 RepID=A0A3E0WCS1_9MICO|nr:dTDP-4-dehydrorhamnose reductase [Subtercola boreus]RFA22623.1 dTDP-4-dehydrorhamnose reductase [Subtercola boreus]RFA22979.1 dTDP-4-dehydrorhamnose reductase [Subtercola boreus]RFA28730.1 dTDP-4-dehydrorhamnose reductase [Subtercola boreus]
MTRYLVTGAGGMLGHDLVGVLRERGSDVTALGRADLDVTDLAAVQGAVAGHDVVFNLAAYTKVDDAESFEDEAFAVNATGAGNAAVAAREAGATIIHVSTDYVFDGSSTAPYAEDTPYAPLSAYGRTKAEGERRVLAEHPTGGYVVRTAWLYGEHGPNFPKTMLKAIAGRDTVSVVDDQRGQPTWTADLAQQLVRLADAAGAGGAGGAGAGGSAGAGADADAGGSRPAAAPGIYHATNAGETTWFGFTQALFTEHGIDPDRVLPTDSAQFVRPAPRPAYSVLGHDAWSRAGIEPMRDWREALHDAAQSGILETHGNASGRR